MNKYPFSYTLLFLLFSPFILSAQDPDDGLLIHYPLDGDVTDASGNSYDGTGLNINFAADRFGALDRAAVFDGNARIELPGLAALKPQPPLSLSSWVYFENLPAAGKAILSTDFVPNAYFGLTLSLDTQNRLMLTMGSAQEAMTFTARESIIVGQWQHLAVVIRSVDDISLYLNGCEEIFSTGNPGEAILYGDGAGNLGRANAGSPPQVNTLNGLLDDFRYYDRALTMEEVNLLYDQFYTPEIDLGPDTMICIGETLELEPATPLMDYTWSDGSMGITLEVSETGAYSVMAETEDCQIIQDSIEVMVGFCDRCEPQVPNAFTPNSDGRNDSFRLLFDINKCRITDFHIKIFNRWGEMVFESTNPDERWDGRYNSNSMPSDVYVFFARYAYESEEGSIMRESSGELSLIR